MTPEPAQPAESPEARVLITDLLWVIDRSHGHRHVEAAERARAYLAAPMTLPTIDQHDAYRLRKVAEAQCGCRIPAPFDEVADHVAAVAFDEGVKRCRVPAATTARPTERGAVEAVWTALSERAGVACDAECNGDLGRHDIGCQRATALLNAHSAALTPPVTVAATDSRITKNWCLNMARLEDGQEIGAGMPDHPLRASEVAATDQAAEVERKAIAAFLEACAAEADRQSALFAGQDLSICDGCKHEAKAYRNAARMILGEDHASYRAALATQPATGRTMGGEDKLREALDWALSEIEGRTRYDNSDQRQNCIDIANDALAASKKDGGR